MPDNAFRLFVVGLLLMVLAYQSAAREAAWSSVPIIGFFYFVIGSLFVFCAFWVWMDERREKGQED